MQSGIDPDKKSVTRKRYVSPSLGSNNSKKSVGKKNFVNNNKRVSSLPSNNRKAPSYARPTRQANNRHQTTSRSPAPRFASGNRGGAYSYNRKPVQQARSTGTGSNANSAKRQATKPKLSGVFSRLYQSKQRDSPLRTNIQRVSPGARVGGYKRSPANRFQRPSPGAREGIKKSSPNSRTTYFQVSSRLYPGAGDKTKSKERESSNDRLNKSRDRKVTNTYGAYKRNTSNNRSSSYGKVPRPFNRSRSENRSQSKEKATRPPPANNAVYERLYGSGTRKSSNSRTRKPPAKPNASKNLNTSGNNDLDVVHEKSKISNPTSGLRSNPSRRVAEESKRTTKENDSKTINTSMERRQAARENIKKQRPNVIEKELVRVKAPATKDIDERFSRIDALLRKGQV